MERSRTTSRFCRLRATDFGAAVSQPHSIQQRNRSNTKRRIAMVAKKQSTSTSTSTGRAEAGTSRKPWKKKTPAEVIVAQRDKLAEDIKAKEAELKEMKEQLAKFDEVIKVFQR